LNLCPLCAEEQADPNNPKFVEMDKRIKPPIPCPEHGDPRILMIENRDAVEIYSRLTPYHFVKEYQSGERVIKRTFFDTNLALKLCEAYKIEDIQAMLDKLDAIHSENFHE